MGRRSSETGREAKMASIHVDERREARYAIAFDIEVSGMDRDGRVFRQRTTTINVSEWGCGFLCSTQLRKDDIVSIRQIPASAPDHHPAADAVLFQVVRSERTPKGWLVGVWKMDSQRPWSVLLDESAEPDHGDRRARKKDYSPHRSGPNGES